MKRAVVHWANNASGLSCRCGSTSKRHTTEETEVTCLLCLKRSLKEEEAHIKSIKADLQESTETAKRLNRRVAIIEEERNPRGPS